MFAIVINIFAVIGALMVAGLAITVAMLFVASSDHKKKTWQRFMKGG